MGGLTVAHWLLNPATEKTIIERQTASKELHGQTAWRQALQAFGKEKKIERSTYSRLQEWIGQKNTFIDSRFGTILRYLVPAIMVAVVILNISNLISDPLRNTFLISSAIIAFFTPGQANPCKNSEGNECDPVLQVFHSGPLNIML